MDELDYYVTSDGKNFETKNGARIIAGYRSKEGYVQVIQLPDGQRLEVYPDLEL